MKVVLYAVLALAIMAMIGTGVYKVKRWGYDEAQAECLAAAEAQRVKEVAASQKAAQELEAERAKRRVVVRERKVYVDKIVDRPIYRNVCLDDDGLRCVNAALKGESTVGCKPADSVPTPAPAR